MKEMENKRNRLILLMLVLPLAAVLIVSGCHKKNGDLFNFVVTSVTKSETSEESGETTAESSVETEIETSAETQTEETESETTESETTEAETTTKAEAKQETKNKTKNVLNQIFKMAVEDNFIARNPLDSSSVKIKGQPSSVTEPYSVDQMRFLASHIGLIRSTTDRAWLALSISLPLRPEEVLGLTWNDVDLEQCVIHVRNTVTHPNRNEPFFKPYTKTLSSIRDLAFPREILQYLPEQGAPDEFVIGGDTPVSYTKLRGICKRVNFDTGFGETITPRRFRTTVATDISAMTHDLKLVQQMLGHSNPQMTLKHYDKGRSNAVDASDAISKAYGLTSC